MLKSPPSHSIQFPPLSWEECKKRGWDYIDILLVTGDAYVDHPSFGVALIYRLLENHGYKVAILSQPRCDSNTDFKQYPSPRLFCGITAGNLDSIVANYTSNGKVRDKDSYSPSGYPWRQGKEGKHNRLRPDRASIIYTSLAKSSYKCPTVLGGIEASLRRFVHYDYKQAKLRASILTDSKADLLIYGMGERAILDIAKTCKNNEPPRAINGTCIRLTHTVKEDSFPVTKTDKDHLFLPSYAEIQTDKEMFLEAEIAIDRHSRRVSRQLILQKQQSHWLIQNPPAKILSDKDLDSLYRLKFTRTTHKSQPNVPALAMIKDSVTIVRGCSGNCSFCAITRHQGAQISSRSIDSIVGECKHIAGEKSFKGTISDLGGPTANLYATTCKIGTCNKKDCLYPKVCSNLEIDEDRFLELLRKVSGINEVKHLFISSGMRMELLLKTPRFLEKMITTHTPGALKIAPEHTNKDVLALMHKEEHELLVRFIEKCRQIGRKRGKIINISPYIITSHPGSGLKHAKCLANDLKKLGMRVQAFQDFTPTPGTISTAMYVSEKSAIDKKKIFVPKKTLERQAQRRIVEKEVLQQGKGTRKNQPHKTHSKKKHFSKKR